MKSPRGDTTTETVASAVVLLLHTSCEKRMNVLCMPELISVVRISLPSAPSGEALNDSKVRLRMVHFVCWPTNSPPGRRPVTRPPTDAAPPPPPAMATASSSFWWRNHSRNSSRQKWYPSNDADERRALLAVVALEPVQEVLHLEHERDAELGVLQDHPRAAVDSSSVHGLHGDGLLALAEGHCGDRWHLHLASKVVDGLGGVCSW